MDPQLTGAIVPYENTTPAAITNYVWSEEYYEALFYGEDLVSMGYSMQNSSGQVVTVTTDNAPVMGEPTRPIRDIRGLDEGIVLDESVKTHNMEIHTSTNAGVVSHVCKKRRIDAGHYVNLEAHPGGGGDGWFSSYGGST
ncbi:hypothetical protein Tco_0849219 [Tanacetum coccineum]